MNTAVALVVCATLGSALASYRSNRYTGLSPGYYSPGSGNVVGVKGHWGDWSEWTSCHCGSGYQTRTRQCIKPKYILFGNGDCHGKDTETKECNSHYCKVNGGWSEWGHYPECSAHCGGGYQTKKRYCNKPAPAYGGDQCYGSDSYTESCNDHYCVVNGGWSEWGHYAECSTHCGGGYHTKKRYCNKPAPAYGGDQCYGSDSYTESCNDHYCVVNGGWSEWGHYAECSTHCGGGYHTKKRYCNKPAPAYGGDQCYGSDSYTESCNDHYCIVNGGWTQWTYWSPCSGNCGSGHKSRTRTCTDPTPSHGGASCYGDDRESEVCHHGKKCYGHHSNRY